MWDFTRIINNTKMNWRSFLMYFWPRNPNLKSDLSSDASKVGEIGIFWFFDDFRCCFWPKNPLFTPLGDIWAQNWWQIRIPWQKIHGNWPSVHFCIISIFCQIQDFPSKMAIFSRFLVEKLLFLDFGPSLPLWMQRHWLDNFRKVTLLSEPATTQVFKKPRIIKGLKLQITDSTFNLRFFQIRYQV